jgi:hypothetical protein
MKAKKMYAKGGPITPDPKKKMPMTADQKFNANARSRQADNLTEMRNALKEEGPEAIAKFDAELKRMGYKVVQKKKSLSKGGMMAKYAEGGKMPDDPTKKPSWVGKGQSPQDPTASGDMSKQEYLEMLTWNEAVKQLEKRGVTMIDKSRAGAENILSQGNRQMPAKNYQLAISKAKEYGVYDQARQDAVTQFKDWQRKQKQQ